VTSSCWLLVGAVTWFGCINRLSDPIHTASEGDAAPPPADTQPDATMLDAPLEPVTVTLAQTFTNITTDANSMGCTGCNTLKGPNGGCDNTYSDDQTYYRVFTLADHAITTAFHVSHVMFVAQSSSGNPQVTVKLGSYAGATDGATLDTGATDFAGAITPLDQVTVAAPMGVGVPVTVPITATVPAGTKLVVAVATPSYVGQTNRYLFVGGTSSTEAKPSYVRSRACGAGVASATASVGFPQARIVITVTGSH
jgi:hypothetical protein